MDYHFIKKCKWILGMYAYWNIFFPLPFAVGIFKTDNDMALKFNLFFILLFKSEVIFMWILTFNICNFVIGYFHGTWTYWYTKYFIIVFTTLNYFRHIISCIVWSRYKFPLFLSWKQRVLFGYILSIIGDCVHQHYS